MKSGYEIKWTDNALKELAETYKYINDNWSDRELKKLSVETKKYLKHHKIQIFFKNLQLKKNFAELLL